MACTIVSDSRTLKNQLDTSENRQFVPAYRTSAAQQGLVSRNMYTNTLQPFEQLALERTALLSKAVRSRTHSGAVWSSHIGILEQCGATVLHFSTHLAH